jgi:hypothetical protein
MAKEVAMQRKTALALVALLTTELLAVGGPSALAAACQGVAGACSFPGTPCSPVTSGTGSKGECTNAFVRKCSYVGHHVSCISVPACVCQGSPPPPFYWFSPLNLSSSTVVPIPSPGSNSASLTISSIYGYTGNVTVSCTVSGPITLTCTPNPQQVGVSSGGTSTWSASITVPGAAPNGTYTVTVNGSDMNHRAPFPGPQSATFTVSHTLIVEGEGGGSVALTVFLSLLALWAIARQWRLVKSS